MRIVITVFLACLCVARVSFGSWFFGGGSSVIDYTQDANCIAAYLMNGTTTETDIVGTNDLAVSAGDTISRIADVLTGYNTNGWSRDFNSASVEYLWIADGSTLDVNGAEQDFSITYWFKSDDGASAYMISKYNGTGNNRQYAAFWDSADSEMYLTLSGDGVTATKVASVDALSSATWYHFGGVYDGSANEEYIYIDGVIKNTNSYSSGIADKSAEFRVGARSDDAVPFDGHIDELAFFDRALSATEVADIYNNGIDGTKGGSDFTPSDVSDLIAWYDAGLGIITNDAVNRVSTWEDQAGTNDLVQATGSKQPTWESSTASFNNAPTVDFEDTASQSMVAASIGPLSQPNTIFLVAIDQDPSDVGAKFFFDGDSGTDRHAHWHRNTSTWSIFAGAAVNGPADDTSLHIHALVFNTTSSKYYLDGGTTEFTSDAGSQDFDGMSLGAKNTDTDHGDFTMGEMLIYDKLLTNDEINNVGNYLADKYGTTWTDL